MDGPAGSVTAFKLQDPGHGPSSGPARFEAFCQRRLSPMQADAQPRQALRAAGTVPLEVLRFPASPIPRDRARLLVRQG